LYLILADASLVRVVSYQLDLIDTNHSHNKSELMLMGCTTASV